MPDSFASAIKRHSAQVANLEQGSADQFLKLLLQLRDEVNGRLLSVGANDAVTAFNLAQILGETQAAIYRLEQKARGVYGKAQGAAVDLAVAHIGEELDMLSHVFDRTPMVVPLDSAIALADPAQGLLARHFESSVQRYGLDLLNGVRQRLFIGLRTGDPLSTVAKQVTGIQGPFGAVGRANADRLVRTEMSNAYGSGHHSGLAQASKEVPSLKKVWLHVGSFLCPTCGPLHGTERSVDGTWTIRSGRKTHKVAHPPGHPNCSCRCTAMKPSWRAGLERLGYLGKQPTTGEDGIARL